MRSHAFYRVIDYKLFPVFQSFFYPGLSSWDSLEGARTRDAAATGEGGRIGAALQTPAQQAHHRIAPRSLGESNSTS